MKKLRIRNNLGYILLWMQDGHDFEKKSLILTNFFCKQINNSDFGKYLHKRRMRKKKPGDKTFQVCIANEKKSRRPLFMIFSPPSDEKDAIPTAKEHKEINLSRRVIWSSIMECSVMAFSFAMHPSCIITESIFRFPYPTRSKVF